MSKGSKITLLVSILVVVIVVAIVWLLSFSPGVDVSITNHSGKVIKDLYVMYKGGNFSFKRLEPNRSAKCLVKPEAESNIVIEFKALDGKEYTSSLGVYIDGGFGGTISVEIESFEQITLEDNIWIDPMLGSWDERDPFIKSVKIFQKKK
jgi:hypothetical protein